MKGGAQKVILSKRNKSESRWLIQDDVSRETIKNGGIQEKSKEKTQNSKRRDKVKKENIFIIL